MIAWLQFISSCLHNKFETAMMPRSVVQKKTCWDVCKNIVKKLGVSLKNSLESGTFGLKHY